jgi:hypothetical protein
MLGVAAGVLEVMLGGAGECCGVLGQSDVECFFVCLIFLLLGYHLPLLLANFPRGRSFG